MKHVFIFGANALSELVYYYLINSNKVVDGFVLNAQYINNDIENKLPTKIFSIEKVLTDFGPNNVSVYVAIAYAKMNSVRQSVCAWLCDQGVEILTYIHPSSIIAANVAFGIGNIILEKVIIQPYVNLGDGNIIWNGANISHHSVIGNFNYIAPSVTISGRNIIHNRCFFGSGCTTNNDIEIHDEVLVGAGAYVYKTLHQNTVFVPQRGIELNKKSNQVKLR